MSAVMSPFLWGQVTVVGIEPVNLCSGPVLSLPDWDLSHCPTSCLRFELATLVKIKINGRVIPVSSRRSKNQVKIYFEQWGNSDVLVHGTKMLPENSNKRISTSHAGNWSAVYKMYLSSYWGSSFALSNRYIVCLQFSYRSCPTPRKCHPFNGHIFSLQKKHHGKWVLS